jgi:hypothetical protein
VSGLLVIGALDVLNPDAWIVRTNAAHGHLLNNGSFDERPLASLSADATPAIVEALPLIPQPQRKQVTEQLLRRHSTTTDWRSFNASRAQAATALEPLR